MSADDSLPAWLLPYEPRLPLDRLVVEVNKIFHAFECAVTTVAILKSSGNCRPTGKR